MIQWKKQMEWILVLSGTENKQCPTTLHTAQPFKRIDGLDFYSFIFHDNPNIKY